MFTNGRGGSKRGYFLFFHGENRGSNPLGRAIPEQKRELRAWKYPARLKRFLQECLLNH